MTYAARTEGATHPVVAYLNHRPPTAAEIARAGGFSRQYAWRVMAGREVPSQRFLAACESLGVPVLRVIAAQGEGD